MNFHFLPGSLEAFQQFLGQIVHDDADKAGVFPLECLYIRALENKQIAVLGRTGGEAVTKRWDQSTDADTAVFGSDHGDGNLDVLIHNSQKFDGSLRYEVEVLGFLILTKKLLPFWNLFFPGNCKNAFKLRFRKAIK